MYFYFTGNHVVTYNNIVSIQHPLKTNFVGFVKAHDFFNFVSKVTVDEIVTKLEKGKLKLKAGKLQATLPTINDADVTKRIEAIAKQASGLKWLKLPDNFGEAINLCKFAASKNESDQTLTCIKLEGTDCIAADNSRAAYNKLAKPIKPMFLKATEVKALLDIKPTGYSLNKSWLFFRNKTGCTFSIRSVQGVYPDFLSSFKFEGKTVEIPDAILEGVDVASIFTDDDTPKINISVANGMCTISVASANGEFTYPHPIKYKGDDFAFSIAPDFLVEMMKHSTEIIVDEGRAKIISGDFQMVISLLG
jgi:DNA polymerase III sliding clamp (beta) subunit (PCNA family)